MTESMQALFSARAWIKSTEDYQNANFPYNGGTEGLGWIGQEAANQTMVTDATTAFTDTTWSAAASWEGQRAVAYKRLLSKGYSQHSLRVLCAVNEIKYDKQVLSTKGAIVDALYTARARLWSPPFLEAFLAHVRLVTAGEASGPSSLLCAPHFTAC
jgi:hypothetical protein